MKSTQVLHPYNRNPFISKLLFSFFQMEYDGTGVLNLQVEYIYY